MECYRKRRGIYILCVLTIWLLILPTASEGCTQNWFGPSCIYLCHCSQNPCNTDGTCRTNDYCKANWFTPDCQYKNMAYSIGHASETPWILSGSRRLIDNDKVVREIVIVFSPSLHFTWMRVVHTTGVSSRFRILYNYKPCPHELYYKLNDETTDISCQMDSKVSQITFLGSVLPHLKQVLVSGGRDVALIQFSNQSTTYEQDGMIMGAWRAVRGYHSQNMYAGSCTHTAVDSSIPAMWSLFFKNPTRIHAMSLYNRDYKPERLAGFKLNIYSHTGAHLEAHTGPSIGLPVYHISLEQVAIPVKYLSIQATHYANLLTLCQVQVFEYEEPCTAGKWGLECNLDCRCKLRQPCHPVTGVCSPECEFGFYGLQCDQECIGNCDEKGCGFYDGLCIECAPGYKGERCDTPCTSITFGKNCTQTCSSSCHRGECDGISGGCLSCPEGKYGSDCSQACSATCKDAKCEAHNGRCLYCPPGYYKEQCDTACIESCTDSTCDQETGRCGVMCPPTTYGDDCKKKCLKNCDKCTDLKCLQCSKSYYGRNCSIYCPNSCQDKTCDSAGSSGGAEIKHAIWLILGIISLFLIVVVTVFVLSIKFICGAPTSNSNKGGSSVDKITKS